MPSSTGRFNPSVSALTVPPIPLVQSWAGLYDGQHGPLIDMSQAVPGYAPPAELLQGIANAAGDTTLAGYGDIEGERALREAHARHVSGQLNADITADNVQITSGCNQAFAVALLVLAATGNRVLVTNPSFFNTISTIEMLGAVPKFVDCDPERGFIPEPADVAQAIEEHDIRVVALISPNNPTGAIYPSSVLADIQEVCLKRNVWLIVDETYADFMHDGGASRHALLSTPDWEANTVLLYSFSKVYCSPALRIGAIVGGRDVVEQTAKVMDNLQICAPRHAQTVLADMVPRLADWRSGNTAEIEQRAEAFRNTLAGAPNWTIASMGAYFAFVRHPFTDISSMEVAERLARDAGVLLLPGLFFGNGQDQYLRFAFANANVPAIEQLAERLTRIE